MNLTSHQKRLGTALVLLPILAILLYLGGLPFFTGVLVVSSLGLWEFYSLFWKGRDLLAAKVIGLAIGGLALAAAQARMPSAVLAVLLLGFWIGNLVFLRAYDHGEARYSDSLVFIAGLLYLPATLQFFLLLSPGEVVLVLLAAFASDTGAYYAGSYFGKSKIWPRISPNKTWMGSVGGMLLCVLTCLVYGLWFGTAKLTAWIVLGICMGLAAQIGDFFESGIKRSLAIKDSGKLLPGHGGILDRIDAVLFVTLIYSGFHLLQELL